MHQKNPKPKQKTPANQKQPQQKPNSNQTNLQNKQTTNKTKNRLTNYKQYRCVYVIIFSVFINDFVRIGFFLFCEIQYIFRYTVLCKCQLIINIFSKRLHQLFF